jgi:hypothetical protein
MPGVFVGFEKPNVSISEVSEKRSDFLARDLPRPDRFGAVDVSSVIYELVANVVFWRVSNDDKVLAWKIVEPLFDGKTR